MSVTFNYSVWVARYPEFASVNSTLAQDYFNEATLFCNNGPSAIPDNVTLALLLNMLTAHIAALNSGVNGNSPTSLVGRISKAQEGTVNVETEGSKPSAAGSKEWYNQTKYGAQYWASSARYRTMHYVRRGFANSTPYPGM